jgi:hypothetical protein
MSDQTSKNTRMHGSGKLWDCLRAVGTPWLAVGLAAGAALGASAGSLAWGLGVGAAIGLGLQQAYGKAAPTRE